MVTPFSGMTDRFGLRDLLLHMPFAFQLRLHLELVSEIAKDST